LKARGYPLYVLKQIKKRMIDHCHKREIIWSRSKPWSKNVILIVMTYGDNTGLYKLSRIMYWSKKRIGITDPFVKNMKFVSAWKQKLNLSEILRI
jgi:hypothetical protein